MSHRQLLALCALFGLISACSDPQLDAQEEVADTAIEPDPDSVEFEPSDRIIVIRNPGSNSTALDPRLETCELEETLDAQIRELVARLADMRLRYTERHPDIVRDRQLLEDLERTALEDCVEELQFVLE